MRLRSAPSRLRRERLAGPMWALLLVGCATTTAPSLGPLTALEFLQDGATTIDQCVQRLGPPSKTIPGAAGGKVLTFWFSKDALGLRAHSNPPPFELANYSLVLSFDTQGVLARHALVKVWGS